MADKQIRIDITAKDDASDALADVADVAERLEDADPSVTVDADTSSADSALDDTEAKADALAGLSPEVTVDADTSTADSALADVESAADDLGRLTPEVTVDADTSAAVTGLEDVEAKADTLTDADREIILKAKVSDASKALRDLRGDLDTTEKKARDTADEVRDVGSKGGKLPAGNAIADLVGPLGDAEGAASTFGGTFEGIGDIAEGLGGKLGLSEKALGSLSTGLGAAGLAAAGIAAAVTYFTGEAKKAKEEQERLTAAVRDYNEALDEGDWEAAGDQLVEMFGGAFDAAEDLGVPLKEVVDYISGMSDDMPTLSKRLGDNKTAMDKATGASDAYYKQTGFLSDRLNKQIQVLMGQRGQLQKVKDKTDDARASFKTTNGILADQNTRSKAVAKALKAQGDTTDKTAKATDQMGRDVRDTTREQRAMERQTERLEEALDDMKGALSFERALDDFHDDFREAFAKVREGRRITRDDILTLKDTVLNVADYAKLHPAEVRAILRKINRGEVREAHDELQALIDERTVETPAGIKLKPNAAADARTDAQKALDAQEPVYIPTAYATPAPGGTSGPGSRPQPQSVLTPTGAPVTNVTMYLPRGYRERDVITAGRRAARRSGGLYRRSRR